MSPNIHVIMMAGGSGTAILPHTIEHYQELGLRSFFIAVHMRERNDHFLESVQEVISARGLGISSTLVDPDVHRAQQQWRTNIMRAHPEDWFLPVDCDEFQVYPLDVFSFIDDCEMHNYDYVQGCLIDRLSPDGSLAPLRSHPSVWEQYPLGGLLTYMLIGGDPRKIVACKGNVALKLGHHGAMNGIGCPIDKHLIPVHHFKWVATLIPYLENRRELYKQLNKPWWTESDRAISYFGRNGKANLADPLLLIAPCSPDYPHWTYVKQVISKSSGAAT